MTIPLPTIMGSQARPHSLAATLAWFTPTLPDRRTYRAVRLNVLGPGELKLLGVASDSQQPDSKQAKRGTVATRRWVGKKAPAVSANGTITIVVQREPDQGTIIDEAIPFGLAVTLAMPGLVGLYEAVRARVSLAQPAPA